MKIPGWRFLPVALMAISMATAPAVAQTKDPNDGVVVGAAAGAPEDATTDAWSQLQESLGAKSTDTRIAALNALSLLGGNARAEAMVRSAMNDHTVDIDVRLAAIVAAGQMDKDRPQHPSFRKELRALLESDDPKLSFTAASTLWALKDTAGEDVLMATAEGERASDYSFWKRSTHNASRTLHSPEALTKIAMQQSLVILVPPVGMGMGAYGYLKGEPGAPPQVRAIVNIGKVHTPTVEKALIVATKTKDVGARIAAAEALSTFTGNEAREALHELMTDDKLQVRLTASAGFLRLSGLPSAQGLDGARPKKRKSEAAE